MPDSPGKGFRRLDQYASNGALSAVYRHARDLAKLREAIAPALDAEARTHFSGVSGDSRRLVIFADSPAWATRLRYQAPAIEEAALRHLGARPRLAFRVIPDSPMPGDAAVRSPWLSERVVSALEASARTVGDEELAEALRRLARGAAR